MRERVDREGGRERGSKQGIWERARDKKETGEGKRETVKDAKQRGRGEN